MPKISTVAQAQDLRDKMRKEGGWHTRLQGWRQIRDRNQDAELQRFAAMLPLELREHFVPSQTPVVDDEIESLKAILAANEPEVQVVSLLASRDAINVAQEAEPGIEALHHELWPIETRMARYDAMLGDAVAFNVTDRLPPGEEIGKYADRKELQDYADAEDRDEAKATPAQKAYRKKYEDSGNHDTAYNDVVDEAKRADRMRWQNRVLDMEHIYWFEDEYGVSMFCEVSETAIAPVIDTLEGYGVKQVDNRLVITKDSKAYEDSALGTEQFAYDGSCNVEDTQTVTVTHIRTRESTAILVEGMPSKGNEKDGLLITFDSPFPKERHTCGAYITAGRVKKRGRVADRYEPVVMPLIVTAQQLNIAKSVQNALIYAESARDTVQQKSDNKIPPLEPTLASKGKAVRDQKLPVSIQGEIVRIPTTGIEIARIVEMLEQEIQSYRSREFFSGTGSSGEPALHLARLQTAQLTKLVPLQTRCATTDKRQIMDILAAQAASGESLYLHTPAPGTRSAGSEPQASEPLELTPEMCSAELDVEITIGAETPESQYAQWQVSQSAVDHGDYGMTEHRNRIGIKDPWQTVMDMAIDAMVFSQLGTTKEPGAALTGLQATMDQRVKELRDALLPILAPPTPDVSLPSNDLMPPEMNGQTPMPPGMIAPPTQTVPNVNGVPANPGAMSTGV